MQTFDWLSIVLTALLVIAFIGGLRRGFFRQIAAIAGIASGFILASKYYAQAGQWLSSYIGQLNEQILYVLGFIAIFLVVVIVVEIIGFLITKLFSLPGLNVINAISGGVVGLALGAFFYGIVLSLLLALNIPALSSAIEGSIVPYYLVAGVTWAYDKLGFAIPDLENALPIFKGFQI